MTSMIRRYALQTASKAVLARPLSTTALRSAYNNGYSNNGGYSNNASNYRSGGGSSGANSYRRPPPAQEKQQPEYEAESEPYMGEARSASSSEPASAPSANPFPSDAPALELVEGDAGRVDWSRSFHGLSVEPFPKEVADVLMAPLDPEDIEIKPDGILYLPEIKYRRILNRAFGPGGWGLAPRGETSVTSRAVSREYALVCHGRLVSVARGEQDYFDPSGIATATEGCKSNALMRCCKDLGIASELWDPRFIRKFKKEYADEQFVEHQMTKKKKKMWKLKGDDWQYPYVPSRNF